MSSEIDIAPSDILTYKQLPYFMLLSLTITCSNKMLTDSLSSDISEPLTMELNRCNWDVCET